MGSPDRIVESYCANYHLSAGSVTLEQAQYHFDLERRLTRRLLESTPENRWSTFEACYNELYQELPWLTETGSDGNAALWIPVLGPPPQRIYEVGSGAGRLAAALADAGYDVEATDISPRRGLRRDGVRLTWSISDGVNVDAFATRPPYDLVISDQLVEHLHPDDLYVHLVSCRNILRDGGRYVLQTPHRFTGPHDVSRVFGLNQPIGMHLREYTSTELARVMDAAGYSDIQAVAKMFPATAPFATRSYLRFLQAYEKLLAAFPPRLRRALCQSLRGPLRPRVFLVAMR
jgi:SAM-dependent methyltransferase